MEKGSSSSSSSGDGLKFGKKIYFEGVGSGEAAAPPPSPAKKGRSGAAQGGRCQVEGCNVDLSDAKAYYCRHKVCGVHSKSSKVIVAGIEQRFCQQCSRFHQLPEFDQGKRSCRRRLAGHNERRRKPPAGPLLSPRYRNLSPSTFDDHGKAGGFVMDFSGYSTIPGRESWSNTTSEQGLRNQTNITKHYELSWPSNPQYPLPNILQRSTARPNYSRPEIPSQGCFNEVPNSNGALSLLSNQPWGPRTQQQQQQQALSLGVNNFQGAHGSAMVQPSVDPGGSIGQFSPWGFKGDQGNNTLHEMGNDMGLAAISQSATLGGQFRQDLGLGQPSDGQYHDEIEPSRGYDSPVHHMHWSL